MDASDVFWGFVVMVGETPKEDWGELYGRMKELVFMECPLTLRAGAPGLPPLRPPLRPPPESDGDDEGACWRWEETSETYWFADADVLFNTISSLLLRYEDCIALEKCLDVIRAANLENDVDELSSRLSDL